MKRYARAQSRIPEQGQVEFPASGGASRGRAAGLLCWVRQRANGRRLRVAGVVVALLAVALFLFLNGWLVGRAVQSTWRSLRVSQANALLTAQQLDALFAETLKRIPQGGGPLGEADEQLLDNWLQADEEFLAENADDLETRFERGVVHRRVAQCFYLKQDFRQARAHYLQANRLFESLSQDHPAVPSYLGEQVDTYVRLGWVNRMTGDLDQSDDAFRQAITLLRDERVANDPNYAPAVSYHPGAIQVYLLDNQVARAVRFGAFDEVLSCLERIVAIFGRLAAEDPDRYKESLAEAESKLKAARLQLGKTGHKLSTSSISDDNKMQQTGAAPRAGAPD